MEKLSEKLSSLLKFCKCRIRSSYISTKLRLSLQSKTATPRKENYDWNVLKSDQELQNNTPYNFIIDSLFYKMNSQTL